MTPGLPHFLGVAVLLLGLGLYTVMSRTSLVGMLLGVEVMLNAANLNFVAFARFGVGDALAGEVFSVFIVLIAAAEVAVALAIMLALFHGWGTIDSGSIRSLRH